MYLIIIIGRTYLYCSPLEYFLRRFNGDETRYFSLCEYTRGVRVAVASARLMDSSPEVRALLSTTRLYPGRPCSTRGQYHAQLICSVFPTHVIRSVYMFLRPFLSLCRVLYLNVTTIIFLSSNGVLN